MFARPLHPHNRKVLQMFHNIGAKIKTLAKVITWLGIVVGLVAGIGMISSSLHYENLGYPNEGIAPGIMYMILIPLSAWISSFLLYGFGQLIEHVASIDAKLNKDEVGQKE